MKSYENFLIYDISFETLIDTEPLRIRFDNLYRFIRLDEKSKYLVFFNHQKYSTIYDRIRYIKGLKSGITSAFPYYISFSSIPLQKQNWF